MSNQKQMLDFHLYAESNPGDETNKLDLKAKAECSMNFLASTFSAIMKNDQQIREAMQLAVMHDLFSNESDYSNDSKSVDELINNILNKKK
jgi:hypothetical protein